MIGNIIKSRRTIHNFQADPIPPENIILQAMEHAVWAPNHHATEPWQFYLIGDEMKKQICQLNAEITRQTRGDDAAEKKLKRWMEVPGWLVLTSLVSKNAIRAQEDYAACCCVAQNLMLYLWEQEIGVKWTTGLITRHKDFYKLLQINSDEEVIVGLFWYGYAKEVPDIQKKALSEKLTVLP